MSDNASSMEQDVAAMRVPYLSKDKVFMESDLAFKEPIGQFQVWFEEARKEPGIIEPNAMCLATASADGAPSARFVLLKGFGPEGFKFFTNFNSRKGQDLKENPRAALTFYWDPLKRSVRIEGNVEKLSDQESDEYFHSRPFGSQIGACVSDQSRPIPGRDYLAERTAQLQEKLKDDKTLPRPSCWGGFRVIPYSVEFWQGQTDRLHDRIRFRRPKPDDKPEDIFLHQGDNGWLYERLAP